HSFPTRRSSDLRTRRHRRGEDSRASVRGTGHELPRGRTRHGGLGRFGPFGDGLAAAGRYSHCLTLSRTDLRMHNDSAGPGSAVDQEELAEARPVRPVHRWRLLTVLLAAQFMANVDTAIANIAAPAIQRDLGASGGEAGLVIS